MAELVSRVDPNLDREVANLSQRILLAIKSAPRVVEYRKLVGKFHRNEIHSQERESYPFVLTFTEPHLYGLALTVIRTMDPSYTRDIAEAFEHETDHFNEARNQGAVKNRLGIIFGRDRFVENQDGTYAVINGKWTGFCSYRLPDSLTPREKEIARKKIARAPLHLSKWDRRIK